MNDKMPVVMTPNPASTTDTARRPGEFTAAFLLLRLFLGLRTLLAGIEKFELNASYSLSNYSENMGRLAQGITGASFLPLWMTKPFAFSLGYGLVVLGAALLLGVKLRITLVVTALVYVALAFGLMAVQEAEGVAWLGVHLMMFVGALLLVRHDRFALWSENYD